MINHHHHHHACFFDWIRNSSFSMGHHHDCRILECILEIDHDCILIGGSPRPPRFPLFLLSFKLTAVFARC